MGNWIPNMWERSYDHDGFNDRTAGREAAKDNRAAMVDYHLDSIAEHAKAAGAARGEKDHSMAWIHDQGVEAHKKGLQAQHNNIPSKGETSRKATEISAKYLPGHLQKYNELIGN